MAKNTTDNEQLPIGAARMMAFVAAGMSIGMALLMYFIFLKEAFSGSLGLVMLAAMLALTAISSVMALNNVRKKILCRGCDKPFFASALAMFSKPNRCVACDKTADQVS